MNSRERVQQALNHEEADQIPLDLGATAVTGMHVQTVYNLRQALQLDKPGTPVKIVEPYQNLGEIKPDLIDALGVDVVGVQPQNNMFGFKNEDWKEWEYFGGTPVLVPDKYNIVAEANGAFHMYPEGDQSVPASGWMPEGGWYFDAIERKPELEDKDLNVEDNLEEFAAISDEDLEYFRTTVDRLYEETDQAILVNIGGTAFGDIALVPGVWMKAPKGIRGVEEWYISTVTRREYIQEVFTKQCEIALENLKKLYGAVGDKVQVIFMSGTDFGTQNSTFLSPKSYRELFQPHQKKLNDWIHENTSWKTFMHSCGSTRNLISDFLDSGYDIINPVQWTAKNMEPAELKAEFGQRACFWGGGVDTQKTLPFGTPADIREEVKMSIRTLGPGGGLVFNPIHNVQPQVPVENLLALYDAFTEFRTY
ncbi:MAG: methyltransferase [Chloroflexi bacterium]|nr:methyltransferase [Chloroflexota bacterium]